MTEIIKYAFDIMKVHRIEGVVESNNFRCKKLLEKLMFSYEGTLRECEIKNGKYISLDYYSKINK